MEKGKIRVALMGHGHLGKWHLDKLKANSQVEVVGVVDPSEQSCWEVNERHPDTPCFGEIATIIDRIDAVIIATPTSTHYAIIRALMERGIHIFCEKPLVTRREEADSLLAFANTLTKEGQKLPVIQVGHSERMHFIWEQRKELSQFFNQPGLVRIDRLAPFKGRACDVDVVADLMIHDLDLLLYLFDEHPLSLKSYGFRSISEHWDSVTTTLNFLSGRVATLTVGRNYTVERREFEIINSAGTLQIDLYQRKVRYSDNSRKGPEVIKEFEYPARDHLKLEQDLFFQAIQNKTPSAVTLSQGVSAVRLTESVRQSLISGEQLDLTTK
jgi:predicted dehydrogenase